MKLPDLMREFDEDCPANQRMDMLRAFMGGAVVVARSRNDEEMVGHVALCARAHIDS